MTKITINSEKKDYTFGDIPQGTYFVHGGHLYLKNTYETIRGNYNCLDLTIGEFKKAVGGLTLITPVIKLEVVTK